MKLEKFDKNKKKKIYAISGIIFVVVAIIGIVLFRSYALYKEEKTFNVLNGKIPDFASGDIEIAFTIDGESSTNTFPTKASGYEVNNVTCENGVTAQWDKETWGLVGIESNGAKKIKCTVDFSKPKVLLVNYLKNLNSSELVDDETTDHNLRYIGGHPNNYVSFNGEFWRIIGVMNGVADDKGVVESRVKLIRDESIGAYSWDNKGNYGSNNWSDSALMNVLNNGAYYERTGGNCPSGGNGATATCIFISNGLTSESKSMISKVKWNLGAQFDATTPLDMYTSERDKWAYGSNPTEWIGEVGLMYPSDYGYATGGGTTTNRKSCLDIELHSWSSYSDCIHKNWLNRSISKWTITSSTNRSDLVFSLYTEGMVSDSISYDANEVLPVVYLNTNLNVKSGTGTITDPFVLES